MSHRLTDGQSYRNMISVQCSVHSFNQWKFIRKGNCFEGLVTLDLQTKKNNIHISVTH